MVICPKFVSHTESERFKLSKQYPYFYFILSTIFSVKIYELFKELASHSINLKSQNLEYCSVISVFPKRRSWINYTKCNSSNPANGEMYSIHLYVIKFASDLQLVGGFLRVLRFHPPIKLTSTIKLEYC